MFNFNIIFEIINIVPNIEKEIFHNNKLISKNYKLNESTKNIKFI